MDRGLQYRSAIFYADPGQQETAERLKRRLDDSGVLKKPVVTEILPLKQFHPAEDYHQDYHQENSLRYRFYRSGSGRNGYIEDTWTDENVRKAFPREVGDAAWTKPGKEALKEQLTPMQFKVTQQDGTEPAFNNEHWDEKRPGVYLDVVSRQPLFSSADKFDSGTGWPSFTRPIRPDAVTTREDRSLFTTRTEVRSRLAGSHLGHVFEDGPPPTGLRYCINSAALRFVPLEELEDEGLGRYARQLKNR